MARRGLPDAERFLAKTQRTDDGCLLWTAALNAKGYGLFTTHQPVKRMRIAHRYWYEMQVGPIPEGMDLDHDCHTRSDCTLGQDCRHRRCVEPSHLIPMTHRENLLRGNGFPARQAAQTHCLRGHPFSGPGSDVRITTHGGRQCRNCLRIHKVTNRDKYNAQQNARRAAARAAARPPRPREVN